MTDSARSFLHHHGVGGAGIHHAELAARDLLDAIGLGPGRLLEFEAAEFGVEIVLLAGQLRECAEQDAVLLARVDDADRAGHDGSQQQQDDDGADEFHPSFSATRNTALRARGLRASSASPGVCAWPIRRNVNGADGAGGKPRRTGGSCDWSRRNCLTARSSREWKLITHRRPPGRSRATAPRNPRASASISPFTAMRRAWKLRVAGCLPEGGRPTMPAIRSANSPVRAMGALRRCATMARAMRRLMRSSP